MNNVSHRHRTAIAEDTLAMSIAGALVMGGMDHPEAYRVKFGGCIHDRARELRKLYPSLPDSLVFEMSSYGWTVSQFVAAFAD